MTERNDAVDSIRDSLHACIDRPYSAARTMPAAFYTSPEFLDFEIEHLFHKEWVCLGRIEEVPEPGDYLVTELAGESLLIVRGNDNNIHIQSNVCRHRGMPVAQGTGRARNFVCPYHAWTYDLDGRLLRTPLLKDRPDFDRRQCRLPQFSCTVWHGFIFVNLDGQASPLEPRLAGLEPLVRNYHMTQMTLRYSKEKTWATNWKCLTENFMEGYHLSNVHRNTLHPITPTRLCEHFPAGDGYLGYFSRFPSDLPIRGAYHPDLSEKERTCSVMFAVMPGLVAGVTGHLLSFVCIQPDTANSVRARLGLAFLNPDISQGDLDNAIGLFERTMAEDEEQLVNLQRGLQSKFYQQAPLAPADYEGTIWDFYQYLARRLTGGTTAHAELVPAKAQAH